MAVLRTHMRLQYLGPHTMAVLGPKCDAICRDHIRLSVLGPHVMAIRGTICHCSFGDHMYDILGTTCHGSSGENMKWHYLDQHTDGSSGEHVQSQIISRDIIAGKNQRCILWGQQAMSVLGTTSYTGVKLKSPPSGVRILNCHTFI